MLPRFRVIRPPNVLKGFQEKLLEQAWAALAEAHRTLADNPHPDTFAGRKTQEPFPSEEDL
jgi:hypothetical protein